MKCTITLQEDEIAELLASAIRSRGLEIDTTAEPSILFRFDQNRELFVVEVRAVISATPITAGPITEKPKTRTEVPKQVKKLTHIDVKHSAPPSADNTVFGLTTVPSLPPTEPDAYEEELDELGKDE